MPATIQYTVGGTVQAGGGIYLPRPADKELLALCRAGTFAYVLTPRQMGKSSLMLRTAEALEKAPGGEPKGIRSVILDLTRFGTKVTPDQWYLGLLVAIADELALDFDPVGWWAQRAHLGTIQRMTDFFDRVVLGQIADRVVVFFDEIDTTIALTPGIADDFYAAVRYFHNARADRPHLSRLSFVMIGVATPGDLIQDPQRTPFNIGTRVDLDDFTIEQARPLARGMGLPDAQAEQVLRWIFDWSDGHPYLTHRLFRDLAERDPPQRPFRRQDVDAAVQAAFFNPDAQDNNLQFVRDMLLRRVPAGIPQNEVLEVYREVRRGRTVIDEPQNLIKSHLKLSGLVKTKDGKLWVRNGIYRRAFDLQWIARHLPPTFLRRSVRALPWGLLGLAAVASFVIGLVARRDAEKVTGKAVETVAIARRDADAARRDADASEARARSEQANAVRATTRAAAREKEADAKVAEAARREAESTTRAAAADARLSAATTQVAAAETRRKEVEGQIETLTQFNRLLDACSGAEVDPTAVALARARILLTGGPRVLDLLMEVMQDPRNKTSRRRAAAWLAGEYGVDGIARLDVLLTTRPAQDVTELAVQGLAASVNTGMSFMPNATRTAAALEAQAAAVERAYQVLERLSSHSQPANRGLAAWGLYRLARADAVRERAVHRLRELSSENEPPGLRSYAAQCVNRIEDGMISSSGFATLNSFKADR